MTAQPHNAAEPPPYAVTSVDNALRLLLAIGDRGAVRLTEASAELGVARSTAHRLLAMLVYRGLAAQDPETKTYVAGPELAALGLNAVRKLELRVVARPILEDLRDGLDETVHVAVLRGDQVLFVDSVESSRPLRVVARTGMSVPAHCSAAGKAMLALLGDDALSATYPRPRLERLTDKSVPTRAALLRELDAIRGRGYSTSSSESEEAVSSVGVAVPAPDGRPLGAISLALPTARFDRGKEGRIVQALCDAAKELAERLRPVDQPSDPQPV